MPDDQIEDAPAAETEVAAAPPVLSFYTIGSHEAGESPWDVALYLWGKGSFGAQLVQANLTRDWEDGVEIVIPDIEF